MQMYQLGVNALYCYMDDVVNYAKSATPQPLMARSQIQKKEEERMNERKMKKAPAQPNRIKVKFLRQWIM